MEYKENFDAQNLKEDTGNSFEKDLIDPEIPLEIKIGNLEKTLEANETAIQDYNDKIQKLQAGQAELLNTSKKLEEKIKLLKEQKMARNN